MSLSKKRSDFVSVSSRFIRSVNLSQDWPKKGGLNDYVITGSVVQALEQVGGGLISELGQKSFVIIGQYGSGKSAFSVFLCSLLGYNSEKACVAHEILKRDAPALAPLFNEIRSKDYSKRGYLIVPVTARRCSIDQVVVEGIASALDSMEQTSSQKALRDKVKGLLRDRSWGDTSVVLELLRGVQDEAKAQSYSGLLLFVDEAGKSLEYAFYDRVDGDIYLLQELAEYAVRQADFPVMVIITLHQQIDDYVELSDRSLRDEWRKVQERFQVISFSESCGATIKLLGSVITHTHKLPDCVVKDVKGAFLKIEKIDLDLPIGISKNEFRQVAISAWPLHPVLLLAMPYLFRRLAQNERSIFSFLTSQEPFGFRYHLNQQLDINNGFVLLRDLFVYFLYNFESGLSKLPYAKRLLEANNLIRSRGDLSELDVELIQTISILNVLSEISYFRATRDVLYASLSTSLGLDERLKKLVRNSILTFRNLDGSFRVWEGSDIDINESLNAARKKLKIEKLSSYGLFSEHLPQQYMFARRHSLKTGISRYFNVVYAESFDQEILKVACDYGEAAGTIVVLFAKNNHPKVLERAIDLSVNSPRLIFAIPTQIDLLLNILEEVSCLRWVEKNTIGLRNDRVAMRELVVRLSEAEQMMSRHFQQILDPRPAPRGSACFWVWRGKNRFPNKPSGVTRLISDACDVIYPFTPSLINELVVRKKLSTASSSARRILLVRMLENSDEETLGINGYPPERSIYESVLRLTGIHAYNDSLKKWVIQPPPYSNQSGLRLCWNMLEEEIFNGSNKRQELTSLYQALSSPPYGLPEGVHPILFLSFFLYWQDELFLYREGSFLPEIQAGHIELMQRRPDLFSISGAHLTGARMRVVSRLAVGLNVERKTAPVVRALYKVFRSLPPVTLKSSLLDNSTAIKARDAMLSADSPEKLLFEDLPSCFNLNSLTETGQSDEDINSFFNCLNEALQALGGYEHKLVKEKRDVILRFCGLKEGASQWSEFENKAKWLASRITNDVLSPFLSCVVSGAVDNHNPRPALTIISGRPLEHWTDMDIKAFDSKAVGVCELYKKALGDYDSVVVRLTESEVLQKNDLYVLLKSKLSSRAESSHVKQVVLRMLLEYEISGDKQLI